MTQKPFSFQLFIIGGFMLLLYMFFTLATSIYKDYRLESQIADFEAQVDKLAAVAQKKPDDVKYFASEEYKDRYAKENLNLLNPGEKVIIIPKQDQIIEKGPALLATEKDTPKAVLNLPNRAQWWNYFFGQTLSVKTERRIIEPALPDTPLKEVEG